MNVSGWKLLQCHDSLVKNRLARKIHRLPGSPKRNGRIWRAWLLHSKCKNVDRVRNCFLRNRRQRLFQAHQLQSNHSATNFVRAGRICGFVRVHTHRTWRLIRNSISRISFGFEGFPDCVSGKGGRASKSKKSKHNCGLLFCGHMSLARLQRLLRANDPIHSLGLSSRRGHFMERNDVATITQRQKGSEWRRNASSKFSEHLWKIKPEINTKKESS